MGELFRYRGLRYVIEDTTNDNPREKEHMHFYDENNNRYQAFFDKKNKCFIFNEEEIPSRVLKVAREMLNSNYDYVESQYENALEGKKVIKITLK